MSSHTAYVLASYGAAFIMLALLSAAILLQRWQVQRRLAALEAAGVKRRSES